MTDRDTYARLADDTRRDLARAGYDRAWFDEATPALRATTLTLYAALRHCGLWSIVSREWQSDVGVLQFHCDNVEELRRALASRNFTPMRTRRWGWESRERRWRASLHLKHFNGWSPDKIQAHVDPIGIVPRWYWWPLLPVSLGIVLLHWWHWHGYQRPDAVRRALLAAGVGADLLENSRRA